MLETRAKSGTSLTLVSFMTRPLSLSNVPNQTPEFLGIKVSPNPFNARTVISFYNSKGGDSTIGIYNVRGERVAVLFKGQLVGNVDILRAGGSQSITWGLPRVTE